MSPATDTVRAAIERRIARAEHLTATHTAAAEMLRFYARLSALQQARLDDVQRVVRSAIDGPPAGHLARLLDSTALAHLVPAWVGALAGTAPAALADAMRALSGASPAAWADRIGRYLSAPADRGDDPIALFVCESLVQPFAAVVNLNAAPTSGPSPDEGPDASAFPATCPCCGGAPVCGELRERGHGAGRALVCGTCATTWPAPRLVCPACGAVEVQALPVFRAEAWPAIRLDACDGCGTYVKSIDLTVAGHAVAVVDDIATVALDVWAAGQGYRKIRPNLLRL